MTSKKLKKGDKVCIVNDGPNTHYEGILTAIFEDWGVINDYIMVRMTDIYLYSNEPKIGAK